MLWRHGPLLFPVITASGQGSRLRRWGEDEKEWPAPTGQLPSHLKGEPPVALFSVLRARSFLTPAT
jgi:hypothetical protein